MTYHHIYTLLFIIHPHHISYVLVENSSIHILVNFISLHWLLSMTMMMKQIPFRVIVVFVHVWIVSMNFPIWIQRKCLQYWKDLFKKCRQVMIYMQTCSNQRSNIRNHQLDTFVFCSNSPCFSKFWFTFPNKILHR